MADESPLPSARRLLLHGVGSAWVVSKLRSYEQLDPPAGDSFPVSFRGPDDRGWLQVDLDPLMPLYHFHNLGMWMMGVDGDARIPDQLILQSRGPVAVDYWLVPGSPDSVLHGRRADGSPYTYDLAGGRIRTEPDLQAPAQSARLSLASRGVSLALIEDWQALPISGQDSVQPWVLEKPGSLLGRFVSGLLGGGRGGG